MATAWNSRQRPAELGAALDVGGGEVAGTGDQARGGERQPGDGVLDQDPRGVVAEQLGSRAVEDHGVLGLAARGRARQQRDAGIRGIDQRNDRVTVSGGGDQQEGRLPSVRHSDLASGHFAVDVGGARSVAEADTRLADGRGQQRLAGGDLGQPRLLLLGRAGSGQGERAAAERLPDGEVRRPGAGLAQEDAYLGQAETLAAVRLRHREREQTGRGPGRPVVVQRAGATVERLADDGAHRLDGLLVWRSETIRSHACLLPISGAEVQQNCNVFYLRRTRTSRG